MPEFTPLRFYSYNWSRKDIDPEKVISPPYDVLSREDVQVLARNKYNVVHIDSPSSYDRAQELLQDWLAQSVLVQDERAGFYILATQYTMQHKTRTRWGVIGGLRLEPFGSSVFPHEETYPKAKEDRLKLMQATQGQLSPIFGVYDDPEQVLEEIGNSCLDNAPLISFYQEDHVHNRLWAVPEKENPRIQELMQHKKIFIADGHHRYETALHFMQSRASAQKQAPWEYIFIYLSNMSSPGLEIFPYHRTVSLEKRFDWDQILDRAGEFFEITFLDSPEFPGDVQRTESMILCLQTGCYLLVPRSAPKDIFEQIGAYILDKYLLRRVMGLSDAELASGRYLHYAHDQDQTQEKVQRGELQAAFFLKSVPMSIMQQACEAGQVMPRKSTFFYPKLPTGMLFHLWDR